MQGLRIIQHFTHQELILLGGGLIFIYLFNTALLRKSYKLQNKLFSIFQKKNLENLKKKNK